MIELHKVTAFGEEKIYVNSDKIIYVHKSLSGIEGTEIRVDGKSIIVSESTVTVLQKIMDDKVEWR